jgi:hypothetical protein
MGLFFPKDLEQIQKLNLQYQNLWTFDITPMIYNSSINPLTNPNDVNTGMRFRVQSINLPRFKLESEKLANGDIYYSGFTFEDSVSMTVFETTNMASYRYFIDWMNIIFDKQKMQFRSLTPAEENNAFRTGILKLYNYTANWSIIAKTLFNSTLKNIGEPLLRSKLPIPRTSNGLANHVINTAYAGTSIIAGESINELENLVAPQTSKKVSGSFIFNNMRIRSIDTTNLDFENGNPLILTINMEVESITFQEGNDLPVN